MPAVHDPCPGTCNTRFRRAEIQYELTGEPNPHTPVPGEPDWCQPCTDRLRLAIRALPDLAARLLLEVENGTPAAREHVSGSRERALHENDAASRLIEQIYDRLTQWEDYVRGERALTDWRRDVRQGHAITTAARFLDTHLAWTLHHDEQQAIELDEDIRRLRRHAERATHLDQSRPVTRDGVPCRECDLMTLESDIDAEGRDSGRIRCRGCGALYSEGELQQWIGMLAAYQTGRAA